MPHTDLHQLEDSLVQYVCLVGVGLAFCWGAYATLSATQAAKGAALVALVCVLCSVVKFLFSVSGVA